MERGRPRRSETKRRQTQHKVQNLRFFYHSPQSLSTRLLTVRGDTGESPPSPCPSAPPSPPFRPMPRSRSAPPFPDPPEPPPEPMMDPMPEPTPEPTTEPPEARASEPMQDPAPRLPSPLPGLGGRLVRPLPRTAKQAAGVLRQADRSGELGRTRPSPLAGRRDRRESRWASPDGSRSCRRSRMEHIAPASPAVPPKRPPQQECPRVPQCPRLTQVSLPLWPSRCSGGLSAAVASSPGDKTERPPESPAPNRLRQRLFGKLPFSAGTPRTPLACPGFPAFGACPGPLPMPRRGSRCSGGHERQRRIPPRRPLPRAPCLNRTERSHPHCRVGREPGKGYHRLREDARFPARARPSGTPGSRIPPSRLARDCPRAFDRAEVGDDFPLPQNRSPIIGIGGQVGGAMGTRGPGAGRPRNGQPCPPAAGTAATARKRSSPEACPGNPPPDSSLTET